jgi:hypothetical protein
MNALRVVPLALLALAGSFAGCTTARAPDGSAVPAESAIAAIHASKCGACHTPPDPKTRARQHVEEALSRHRKRVRLTSDQWGEMADYLSIPEGKTARQP